MYMFRENRTCNKRAIRSSEPEETNAPFVRQQKFFIKNCHDVFIEDPTTFVSPKERFY